MLRAQSRGWAACLAALIVAASAACQSTSPAETPLAGTPITLPALDERALLLLLADRQIYESFAVNRAFDGSLEERRDLATTIGRIGSPEGRPIAERLLEDPDEEVRLAAIFALGELEDPVSTYALLPLVGGTDRAAAILAVEALAKMGVDLAEVTAALGALDDGESARRLLPSLYRFDKTASLLIAARWLALDDAQLHSWAAYALARNAVPEAATYLRPLLGDPDPWVRGWAARALGSIGSIEDLSLILPLLQDDEPGPTIQALRAARALADGPDGPLPPDWASRIQALFDDPRPGVRVTALEAAAAWLPEPSLGARLRDRFENGSPRERQVALSSLASGGDPAAADLVRRAAADPDVQLRRRAASAAAAVGLAELLEAMLSDPHPAVRADTVSALMESEVRSAAEIAILAIQDPSPAVRAVAMRWLVDQPVLSAERIVQALEPTAEDDARIDLEVAVVQALAAREGQLDAEAVVILDAFDTLMRSGDYLVKREVAEALSDMGIRPPDLGPATEALTLNGYRDVMLRTSRTRWARIETERGSLLLRLACPSAPLTCLSFLSLAEQGFFDGLTFHRVVADFVVQGGDPSGGGWGGPGYSLRDEINRLRYDTGVIGMAHAGPDTAGSQFFIALSPQPHLDGGYTVFGRVVDGLDVLNAVEQEDRILRIREVSAPTVGR